LPARSTDENHGSRLRAVNLDLNMEAEDNAVIKVENNPMQDVTFQMGVTDEVTKLEATIGKENIPEGRMQGPQAGPSASGRVNS